MEELRLIVFRFPIHRFTASANRRFDRQAMKEFLTRDRHEEPKVSHDNPEKTEGSRLSRLVREMFAHDRSGRGTRDFSAINASSTLSALLNRGAKSHAGCCRSKPSGLAREIENRGYCRHVSSLFLSPDAAISIDTHTRVYFIPATVIIAIPAGIEVLKMNRYFTWFANQF